MKNIINIIIVNNNRRVLILLSILLFVSRMAFPSLKYPFAVVYFFSLISCVFFVKKDILRKTAFFLKATWQFSVLGIFLLLAMFQSVNIVRQPFTEILSFIIILSFAIQIVITEEDLKSFLDSILEYIVYSSVAIALLGIFRFILTFNTNFYMGTSLVEDHNFYALFSVYGIVGVISRYKHLAINIHKYWLNIFLFILYFNILFSYSRRGFIILSIILICLTLLILLSLQNKSRFLKIKEYLLFYFSTIIFSSLLIFFIFGTGGEFKKQVSIKIGAEYSSLKTFASTLSYRYITIFNQGINYRTLAENFFGIEYNSNDPESWNVFDLKTTQNLTGTNANILPANTKGIILDNTIKEASGYNNARKFIKVFEDTLTSDASMQASIYCYVSEDFDGSKVSLFLKGALNKHVFYDMSRKGEWQKLVFNKKSKKGVAQFYITIEKEDAVNFSTMKGYAIFAYPSLQKIEFNSYDPNTWGINDTKVVHPLEGINVNIVHPKAKGLLLDSTSSASSRNNIAHTYTRIFYDSINKGDQFELSVFCYVSTDFEGEKVRLFCHGAAKSHQFYDMSQKGIWQELRIRKTSEGGVISGYLDMSRDSASSFNGMKGHVIFANPDKKIKPDTNRVSLVRRNKSNMNLSSMFNPERVMFIIHNKLVRQLKDTLMFDNDYTIDSLLQNNFVGQRTARWFYAYTLFSEYSMIEKFFGDGFNYMAEFAKMFGEDDGSDYPHNPIISAFLYSGIIGGLFYIYFLFLTFWYYWKYRKHHMVFFIMYLITFFFVFFSGDSHFDIPIFAFLSFIPFITRYVVKKKGDKNVVEKMPE